MTERDEFIELEELYDKVASGLLEPEDAARILDLEQEQP